MELEKMSDFELYKTAKKIALGVIPYTPAAVETAEDVTWEDESSPQESCLRLLNLVGKNVRLIELIDVGDERAYTVMDGGFFAFQSEVKMAIVNCDELSSELLDESCVRGLFLGKRVSKISKNILAYASRYIYVVPDNPHFYAENNVLYSKNQKRLYRYAPSKPEEEYRVPPKTRELCNCCFWGADNLKRLYLPKGIRTEKNCHIGWCYIPKSTQVIYYTP